MDMPSPKILFCGNNTQLVEYDEQHDEDGCTVIRDDVEFPCRWPEQGPVQEFRFEEQVDDLPCFFQDENGEKADDDDFRNHSENLETLVIDRVNGEGDTNPPGIAFCKVLN
jgi:hypothetical protein